MNTITARAKSSDQIKSSVATKSSRVTRSSLKTQSPRQSESSRNTEAPLKSDSVRIAFIQSCWHRDIVDASKDGFLKTIQEHGIQRGHIDFFEVPGAFEIPLHAKLLAKSGRYAAIVAAGFVVDGGIYRHEFVAASVIDALMTLQLDTEIPVLSLVLTPQRFQHDEHGDFFRSHFVIKGAEAARACAATIAGLRSIRA